MLLEMKNDDVILSLKGEESQNEILRLMPQDDNRSSQR